MTFFKNRKFQADNLFSVFFLLVFFLMTSSCATMEGAYHAKIMKGSVIEARDSSVYLCIGTKDGAAVGQEFDVYKTIVSPPVIRPPERPTTTYPPPGSQAPTFKRELTGRIKITKVIDEHFAEAPIISGKAEKDSIVELSTP